MMGSPSPIVRRRMLLALLLGWPVVGLVGIGVNRLAGSHAPAAAMSMLWLLVVAFVIEQMHAE